MIKEFAFSYSELIVGILVFISTILGFIIKAQHDKILSIKDQISDKKYNVYNEIFSIFFDISKHSVNHVFFPQTSVINFTSKKQSYDDTRRSSRDNELLQRAQSDL